MLEPTEARKLTRRPRVPLRAGVLLGAKVPPQENMT